MHCFLEKTGWVTEVTRALKARRERLGFQDNQGDQEQWDPRASLCWAPQVAQGFLAPPASRATVDPVLMARPVPLDRPDPPHVTAQQ